jgi:hypothetical protein
MLIDVSLWGPDKDGGNAALDMSVVTPVAMTYCRKSATVPLRGAEQRDRVKFQKYAEAYNKEKLNIHFIYTGSIKEWRRL